MALSFSANARLSVYVSFSLLGFNFSHFSFIFLFLSVLLLPHELLLLLAPLSHCNAELRWAPSIDRFCSFHHTLFLSWRHYSAAASLCLGWRQAALSAPQLFFYSLFPSFAHSGTFFTAKQMALDREKRSFYVCGSKLALSHSPSPLLPSKFSLPAVLITIGVILLVIIVIICLC